MFIKEISEETAVLAQVLPSEILLLIDTYKRSSVFADRVQSLENSESYLKYGVLHFRGSEIRFKIFPYRIILSEDGLTVLCHKSSEKTRLSEYERHETVYDDLIVQKHGWFYYSDEYPYYSETYKNYIYKIK
jgi:hypothetical protein